MVEPASLANFFTIFFAAAMVIVPAALHALLFAFSRIEHTLDWCCSNVVHGAVPAGETNLLKHPSVPSSR